MLEENAVEEIEVGDIVLPRGQPTKNLDGDTNLRGRGTL